MNIYVGNLSHDVNQDELKELFETKGSVSSAKVIMDKFTGESRGFGFVEMSNEDGKTAISELDGYNLKGRSLRVNEARPKKDNNRGGGGFNRRSY